MPDYDMLDKLVVHLQQYALQVVFVAIDDDRVAIAELTQHKILVNTSSRAPLEIVFTIAHLFGHYIQFANYEKYRSLIQKVKEEPKPLQLPKGFKAGFYDYEMEAFQIGKKLLENIQKFDPELERKYQLFFETDFELFWQFLTVGTKQSAESFNRELNQRYETDKKDRAPLVPIDYPSTPVNLHHINLIVY
ncbi:MAG TPA: hypothetical protein VHE34_09960 [Puia sp.]|uniref:hypothetical protein n=1 Tax=Puia sp. TaxID=2045100 RepID=UPI002C4DB276|nr:hypothetical protein [Puia sp.]HVU95540.1 hypothetical protein [Puia sp.]